MLNKSLIQFSADGWSCVPSLLFTWGQTMAEIMKIMGTSFKSPMHPLLHSVPPTLQQTAADPRLCQRLLDTHGQVWVSLLWDHCSFLLGPGVCNVLFVPSKSLFTQFCVSSGSSMVEFVVTSSAYAIPKSTAPSYTQEPLPLQQSTADPYLHRRHSNTVLSQSLRHAKWAQ